MNTNEAIQKIKRVKGLYAYESDYEALDMAISALEQQGEDNEWCHDCKEYDKEQHCCHRFTKVIRQAVEEHRREWPEGKWTTERIFSTLPEPYQEDKS